MCATVKSVTFALSSHYASPWGARFNAPVQTDSEAHPASYKMGTESFPGVTQPKRGVDHPPPSSAKGKERVELYLYFPSRPLWPVLWWTLTSPLTTHTFIVYTKQTLRHWTDDGPLPSRIWPQRSDLVGCHDRETGAIWRVAWTWTWNWTQSSEGKPATDNCILVWKGRPYCEVSAGEGA
jgi:hypothetical protein